MSDIFHSFSTPGEECDPDCRGCAKLLAHARAEVAKRLQFAEERRAAIFVKAECDRRAAAGELKKLRARIAELEEAKP